MKVCYGVSTTQRVAYLETDVDIRPVDRGRPPQREATVGDLVETRPLRVCQLLVLHRFLEAACLVRHNTRHAWYMRQYGEGKGRVGNQR